MINIENINMSVSDEKPITDEDILEKINEMRHQLIHGQTKSSVIRLVNDPDRNEYNILFKINTANTRSQLRTGEVGIHISQTVEGGKGRQVQVRRSTRVDNLSDGVIIEITRNLLNYIERFFETAPDKKKQRKEYEEYVETKDKETSWNKSGTIPVLVCQNFETNVESRPHVELPQIDEMANLSPVRTFYGAFLSLVDLYHPAVIIMHLLKESVEDFPYYVTDRLAFDEKYEKFVHNVRRDEMTIRDLFEKGITPAHVCEILLDALKENYDEAKNIPECFSIASDNVFSFVKDFCEKVCKSKEKPIDVPYQVDAFISTCEELGFSSAKSVHALLRACYDSVDNMMNFFKGDFKWSDTLVDDPAHFIGFLQSEYDGEMNKHKLLGELYEALGKRFSNRTIDSLANKMVRMNECDVTLTPKKFSRFIIALVNELQSEKPEEVNDEEPIQPVDTECFAVGVKGVSLEQFKRWLKYHPGASFELL